MLSKMSNQKTIYNLIVKIISMLVSFSVTLIITNTIVMKIGKEVYGYSQMSNDFVNYATVISVALNSMASRYITISFYNEDINAVNKYFNTVLFSNIILGITLFIPIILITLNLEKIIQLPNEYIFDIKLLFLFMFLNFIITICTTVFGIPTFIKNRIDLDSYRSIESNIIKLGLIIVIYSISNPKIWYLGLITILSNIYVVYRNIKYTKLLTPEIKIFQKKYFKFAYMENLISSGIWNSFTKVSSILLSGLDLVIANNFVSSYSMGLLSIAKTIPKYIISSMTSISSVFTPGVMIDYAKGDKTEVVNRINFSIKINSVFSLIIEVIVIVLGKRMFELWLPNQNADILQMISVIAMLGYIIVMPFEVLWTVFIATNKVKVSSIYLFIESIVTLVCVFILLKQTNNVLYKTLIIAGCSSFFEILRGITFLPLVSSYYLNIPKITFYKPLIRFLIAFIISVFCSSLLNSLIGDTSWINLFFLMLMITLFSLGVSFSIIFNINEKKKLLAKMRYLLRRYLWKRH